MPLAITTRLEKPCEVRRITQIEILSALVEYQQALGATEREAIRHVARQVNMAPIAVKRLVVLYPEA